LGWISEKRAGDGDAMAAITLKIFSLPLMLGVRQVSAWCARYICTVQCLNRRISRNDERVVHGINRAIGT
jgi:hypothetical protein